MCLITTKDIPEIAQEDIVCYKFYVLHKVKDDINLPSYDKDGYLQVNLCKNGKVKVFNKKKRGSNT